MGQHQRWVRAAALQATHITLAPAQATSVLGQWGDELGSSLGVTPSTMMAPEHQNPQGPCPSFSRQAPGPPTQSGRQNSKCPCMCQGGSIRPCERCQELQLKSACSSPSGLVSNQCPPSRGIWIHAYLPHQPAGAEVAALLQAPPCRMTQNEEDTEATSSCRVFIAQKRGRVSAQDKKRSRIPSQGSAVPAGPWACVRTAGSLARSPFLRAGRLTSRGAATASADLGARCPFSKGQPLEPLQSLGSWLRPASCGTLSKHQAPPPGLACSKKAPTTQKVGVFRSGASPQALSGQASPETCLCNSASQPSTDSLGLRTVQESDWSRLLHDPEALGVGAGREGSLHSLLWGSPCWSS